MSRDWCAIYAAMLGRPKYRRLSVPARAALFHVWLLAGGQTPEATWPSRADLADMLELDGYPPAVVDELTDRRWLDIDPAGRVLVHDWDDHQLAATLAARRTYEADRKQDWRRRRQVDAAPLSPDPSLPVQDRTSQDSTGQESRHVPERPGHVRDTRPTRKVPTDGRCLVCQRPATDTDEAVRRTPDGLVHDLCRDAMHAGARRATP